MIADITSSTVFFSRFEGNDEPLLIHFWSLSLMPFNIESAQSICSDTQLGKRRFEHDRTIQSTQYSFNKYSVRNIHDDYSN